MYSIYFKIIIINYIIQLFWFVFNILWFIIDEIICWHWYIRKTYQTSLYRFNSSHEFKLRRKKYLIRSKQYEFRRLTHYSYIRHIWFFRIFISIIDSRVTNIWYYSCWIGWCWLTYYLYYNSEIRDLGPSYDVFDYNPDIDMGLYRTIGFWLLFCWFLWTLVANSVFIVTIFFILNRFFFILETWRYWYELTIFGAVLFAINFCVTTAYNVLFILINYIELIKLSSIFYTLTANIYVVKVVSFYILYPFKSLLLWFPWSSFINFATIFFILCFLVLLVMNSTENVYYMLLYAIFLIFLFASFLIFLDLDIFAGILLLIESVIVLMLFFLVIYLAPNIKINMLNTKLKLYLVTFIYITLSLGFVTNKLGESWFYPFSLTVIFLEDFYGALNEIYTNDLTSLFINLYWTNSLLTVIIGLLLFVSSIICVVLISFFTKIRNFNMKSFLDLYEVVKTCLSFIFLRKQNLSTQGKTHTSSRTFSKQTFDSSLHKEYKQKQEIFEEKKKKEAEAKLKNNDTKK